MSNKPQVPWHGYIEYPEAEMHARATELREEMQRRRSIRAFSERPVPREIVEACVQTAATAPSGANQQPWHFVVVQDGETKRRIREAAETEERAFYGARGPAEWVDTVAPLGTTAKKSFLEQAPYLIVVFAQAFALADDGRPAKHYYVMESVGIATGMLVAAVHHAGLAVLTYTPSRMRFLRELLGRPRNERPFMVLVVGYPAPDATVPTITRKPFVDVVTMVSDVGPARKSRV